MLTTNHTKCIMYTVVVVSFCITRYMVSNVPFLGRSACRSVQDCFKSINRVTSVHKPVLLRSSSFTEDLQRRHIPADDQCTVHITIYHCSFPSSRDRWGKFANTIITGPFGQAYIVQNTIWPTISVESDIVHRFDC